MREVIYEQEMKELSFLSCEIEMDEAMFGGKGACKRGWGASRKSTQYETYYPDRKFYPEGGFQSLTKKSDLFSESPSTLFTSLDIRRRFLLYILFKGNIFF